MREIRITENEAGQRLDKLLAKFLKEAPKSFLYKMLRKKNITLNGKKASGSEKLSQGDAVKLFLSEETIEKFSGNASDPAQDVYTGRAEALDILYEDTHVLLLNKPAGMLSQKAREEDVSAVEHLTRYLLDTGALTKEALKTFRPSVCNRLDRNRMHRRFHREPTGLDGTTDGNEAWCTAKRRKQPCVRPATVETGSCSSGGV